MTPVEKPRRALPPEDAPAIPLKQHRGRPRIPAALEAKARAMVLRGEPSSAIIEKLKIGGATLTRIREEIGRELDIARREAMQKILTGLLAGGMTRARGIELLYEVTGIRLT